MLVSMTDEDVAERTALDADDRALAIPRAGHAVVAHALGADVVSVEIDVDTGNGNTETRDEIADKIENLGVCVAGFKAELAFTAKELRLSKKLAAHTVRSTRDYQQIQKLLLRLPEVERLGALVEGFRLADVTLKANADVVHRIADMLFARRFSGNARIERDELSGLFAGDGRS